MSFRKNEEKAERNLKGIRRKDNMYLHMKSGVYWKIPPPPPGNISPCNLGKKYEKWKRKREKEENVKEKGRKGKKKEEGGKNKIKGQR